MILSEWEPVWTTAAAIFAREPIEFQLIAGLAGAFLALMTLEGLRANFAPVRKPAPPPAAKAAAPAALAPPQTLAKPLTQPLAQPLTMPSSFAAEPGPAPRQLAAATPHAPTSDLGLRKSLPRNRKREANVPRPHSMPRPQIRRRSLAQYGEQASS